MNQYPKGNEIYLVIPVCDSVWYEKQLLDIFVDRYERATFDGEHTIGDEYFVGNLDEMIYIIQTFIHNHYPNRFVHYQQHNDDSLDGNDECYTDCHDVDDDYYPDCDEY